MRKISGAGIIGAKMLEKFSSTKPIIFVLFLGLLLPACDYIIKTSTPLIPEPSRADLGDSITLRLASGRSEPFQLTNDGHNRYVGSENVKNHKDDGSEVISEQRHDIAIQFISKEGEAYYALIEDNAVFEGDGLQLDLSNSNSASESSGRALSAIYFFARITNDEIYITDAPCTSEAFSIALFYDLKADCVEDSIHILEGASHNNSDPNLLNCFLSGIISNRFYKYNSKNWTAPYAYTFPPLVTNQLHPIECDAEKFINEHSDQIDSD